MMLDPSPVVARPIVVSGPSPYADCATPLLRFFHDRETVAVNAEVEPWVAVDPSDPLHLVGVWQQDRFEFGGAHGLAAAASFDGGTTWTESTLPFSVCAPDGLDFQRASDPWVSIGPDGTVYAISLVVDVKGDRDNGVAASVSHDGGLTWNAPVLVRSDVARTGGNDKESITADPLHPGVAYAVWSHVRASRERDRRNDLERRLLERRQRRPFGITRFPAWFSMTVDAGTTWSTPRRISDVRSTISNQIVVDPSSGTLYDVFDEQRIERRRFVAFVKVMRSDDGGATWSESRTIARDRSIGVTDPNTRDVLRTGNLVPDAAIDPTTGTLYVVWEDARFSDGRIEEIALSRSTDGGETWSRPRRVNTPTRRPAFTPSVEVLPDGTVGVSYYDLRYLERQKKRLPTACWLVELQPDGRTLISETRLAGPFDALTAPQAGGYFLGDYEGLAVSKGRFVGFFAMTNSRDTDNRTDIVSVVV